MIMIKVYTKSPNGAKVRQILYRQGNKCTYLKVILGLGNLRF